MSEEQDPSAEDFGWPQRWLDYPRFPSEKEIKERATELGPDQLLTELISEGDHQSSRAAGLFTAAAFGLATVAIVRASVGLSTLKYVSIVGFASLGIGSSLAAQLRRVGKLTVGLDTQSLDVIASYRAVRKKALFLAAATITVIVALFLLALFTAMAA